MSSDDKAVLAALGFLLTFFAIAWASFIWLMTEVMT